MAAAVAVASGLSLAGCGSRAVDVPVAEPTGATRSVCLDFDAALPDTLLAQAARTTEPDSPFTAAWGSPAITMVCGVARPAERTADAQLFEIEGVTWFAQELTEGTRFTSEGRVANVQVNVPATYRPEADALVELAPALKDAIPPRGR